MKGRNVMKLLLIGGGGREHALAWKLSQSSHVEEILVVPGNPGIARVPKCKCVDLALDDLNKMADYAEENSIDLTVVGPEATLVAGIADIFRSRGLPIFGPNKAAAEIEGSKAFSRPGGRQGRRGRHDGEGGPGRRDGNDGGP